MKIYIMGPTGSGKTFLSIALSKKYHINRYELDKIVYNQNSLGTHKSDEEINNDFEKIINQNSWIIEDIGRTRFIKGREKSDKIYYLKRSPITVYRQMILRWIRQKVGKEDYNVKPTINHFFKNLSDVKAYFNIESSIINSLKEYQEKVNFLDKKQQVKLLKD